MELTNRTTTFVAPSGATYEIREQNGEDENILSNPKEMRTLLHLSRFISAIVVKNTITNGRLTLEDALNLPLLDRYCILIQSRIFSIDNILKFEYNWGQNTVTYEDNLEDYLFSDYSQAPSAEEINEKPNAIPFYPDPEIIDGKEFTLNSGKKIIFHAATGKSEQELLKLSEDKRTRNAELISRDLELCVEGNYEKVRNFSLFSVKDMTEIRKLVNTYDPAFMGLTDIEDPNTGRVDQFPLLAAPSFFFPTEL